MVGRDGGWVRDGGTGGGAYEEVGAGVDGFGRERVEEVLMNGLNNLSR